MVANNYSIPPNFPVGVIPGQLLDYMVPVWPADVFPISTITRTKPDPNGIVTTGVLLIETQRDLTVQENSDAIDAFLLFVPTVNIGGGLQTAQLEAARRNGQTVYVVDASRQGAGTGVLCYWDVGDRTWRRVRDDVSVAVIP